MKKSWELHSNSNDSSSSLTTPADDLSGNSLVSLSKSSSSGSSSGSASGSSHGTSSHQASSGPLETSLLLQQKESECANLQQTISALTCALHEINIELRDKVSECDTLQQTIKTLSDALQETDDDLQMKKYQNEQLNLKLSAVTFIDVKQYNRQQQSSDDELEGGKGKKKGRKKKKKKDKKKKRKKRSSELKIDKNTKKLMAYFDETDNESDESDDEESESSDFEEDVDAFMGHKMKNARGMPTPAMSTQGSKTVRPVFSVDGSVMSPTQNQDGSNEASTGVNENKSASASSTATTNGPPSTGTFVPCQAAFYQVIHERDRARKEADKLNHEVRLRREQVRKLRGKLNKAQGLVELSYSQHDDDGDDKHVRDLDRSIDIPEVPAQPKRRTKERQRSPVRDISSTGDGQTTSPMKWLIKGQKVKSAKTAVKKDTNDIDITLSTPGSQKPSRDPEGSAVTTSPLRPRNRKIPSTTKTPERTSAANAQSPVRTATSLISPDASNYIAEYLDAINKEPIPAEVSIEKTEGSALGAKTNSRTRQETFPHVLVEL